MSIKVSAIADNIYSILGRILALKAQKTRKIQLWRALSASALTFTCFQNLLQIFSRVFYAHKSQLGCLQYHFGQKTRKLTFSSSKRFYHQKYSFSARCRRARYLLHVLKTFHICHQRYFMPIKVSASAHYTILERILVLKAQKTRKIAFSS